MHGGEDEDENEVTNQSWMRDFVGACVSHLAIDFSQRVRINVAFSVRQKYEHVHRSNTCTCAHVCVENDVSVLALHYCLGISALRVR